MAGNHLCSLSERLRVFTLLVFFPSSSCWPLLPWCKNPSGPRTFHCRGFTIRHTTLGRISLDKWSVQRRDHTWQHTTLTTERHPCPQRTRNPSKGAAADPRLESRVRWDGPKNIYYWKLYSPFLQSWCAPIFVSYRESLEYRHIIQLNINFAVDTVS
jgi:hypothetical protein